MSKRFKLAAVIALSAVAGATPSLLGRTSSALEFDILTIRRMPLPDGGSDFHIVACANVVTPGNTSSGRICSNHTSPDAGQMKSAIEQGMTLIERQQQTQEGPF